MTDLPATIACSSSSRFRIQRRKQLVPCIKEKTQPSWLRFFWGEEEIAWEQNLRWVILSTTGSCVRQAGPTTGKCAYSPASTYSDRMSHCCNASRRPAHECSSLNMGPGAKGHFHLNKAKGLGELCICEASLLDHRNRFSAAAEERENAPVADYRPPERSLLSQKWGDTRQKLRSTKRNEESFKKKKGGGGRINLEDSFPLSVVSQRRVKKLWAF